MITRFGKVLSLSALVGFAALSSAMATPSYLDGSAKMRGQFGDIPSYSMRSAPVYRAPGPAVAVRPATPNAERRFSYEPAPSAAAGSGCGSVHNAQPAPSAPPAATSNAPAQGGVAKQNAPTRRSFSYEPGTAPATGRARASSGSVPLYALPKSDPRKVGGR